MEINFHGCLELWCFSLKNLVFPGIPGFPKEESESHCSRAAQEPKVFCFLTDYWLPHGFIIYLPFSYLAILLSGDPKRFTMFSYPQFSSQNTLVNYARLRVWDCPKAAQQTSMAEREVKPGTPRSSPKTLTTTIHWLPN